MAAGRWISVVRDPRQAGGATFLELFFDLAFVFAFTRLSQELYDEVTWHGVWHTMVTLLALWWVWSTTVWLTERLDPNRFVTQLVVLVIMFFALVLAAAVPGAFEEHGTIFALGYVTIQLVRGLFLLVALRGHPLYRSTLQALAWALASGVLWVVGGPVDRQLQEPLWTAAIIVDYVGASFGWPLPGKGKAYAFDLPVGSEHLSERYRQFLIVALGDMVLVTAATFSEGGLTEKRWLAFVSAFVTTALLWRIYIFRAGEMLSRAIAAAKEPALSSLAVAYAHLMMIAGIVFTTVANELTINHPFGAQKLAWTAVVVGGPAVFLLGRSLFEFTVFGRLSRARLAGLAAILALFPLAYAVPLVATTALIDGVLLLVAAVNTMTWRIRPATVRQTQRPA